MLLKNGKYFHKKGMATPDVSAFYSGNFQIRRNRSQGSFFDCFFKPVPESCQRAKYACGSSCRQSIFEKGASVGVICHFI